MSSFQRVIAFAIGAIFYAYVMITRNLHVVITEQLCSQFGLTETLFGQYKGIYFLTYCATHLPIAYLLDRVGPRTVVSISALVTAMGISPILWSKSPFVLILGRMLVGAGSSAAILSVFKINRAFFSPEMFGRLLGVAGMTGLIASFLGISPLQRIICNYGYQATISYIIAAGALLSFSALIFISKVESFKQEGFFHDIKTLFKIKNFWIVVLIGGLMIGIFEGYVDGWSVPLLTSLFSFNTRVATDITSIIPLSFAVGSVSMPIISRALNWEKGIFGFSGLMIVLGLMGFIYTRGTSLACLCLLFYSGLFFCLPSHMYRLVWSSSF